MIDTAILWIIIALILAAIAALIVVKVVLGNKRRGRRSQIVKGMDYYSVVKLIGSPQVTTHDNGGLMRCKWVDSGRYGDKDFCTVDFVDTKAVRVEW